MLVAEVAGLNALAEAEALRIPSGANVAPGAPVLVMEWIEPGRKPRDFGTRLGNGLANLHQATAQATYGFSTNNWIGATPQPNPVADDWVDFWREQRLEHQLRLASTNGYQGRLQTLGRQLAERLEEWIGEPAETACLLHGDLWSGNVLCDTQGDPVLIDPAVYYGRREADIAMTFVFGGFDQSFYDAYNKTYPLASGWRQRMAVYELYHLLNHLNLFGGSYLNSCMAKLEQLTG